MLHTGPYTQGPVSAPQSRGESRHTHTGILVPGSLAFLNDLPTEQGFRDQMKKAMPMTMPSAPRPKATPHSTFSRSSEGRGFWGTRAEGVRSAWRPGWGALCPEGLGDQQGRTEAGKLH